MNKELMMKAAVQFKGVWPDVDTLEYNQLAVCLKRVGHCTEGNIYAVCKDAYAEHWRIFGTRNQFEAFVESLFEGAPEDATHRGKDNLFYRINDNSAQYWKFSDKWAQDLNGKDWLSKNLIPRPFIAKRAEPKAPYMPKIEEVCEYCPINTWIKCTVKFIGERFIVLKAMEVEVSIEKRKVKFRPLRTERELFIEQAIEDYLDQVGSDAVNAKWFERVFGAMYDAGYRKTRD